MDRTLSLAVKFAMFDRLTAPMRRMGTGARGTARDLASTRREVVQLERSAGKLKGFSDATAKLKKTEAQLADTRRRMDELKTSMAGSTGPTGRLAQQLTAAEARVTRLGGDAVAEY